MKELHDKTPILLNARTVKFILNLAQEGEHDMQSREEKANILGQFLQEADDNVLVSLYGAATSSDGYGKKPKFIDGFRMLEVSMLERGLLTISEVNRNHDTTTLYDITVSPEGKFIDMESGETRDEIIRRYSLMKFGSAREIRYFSASMARRMIDELQRPDSKIRAQMTAVKTNGEHVTIMAPGYRNVESASNMVIEQAAALVNIALAQQDLPTIIVKKLTRLGSNQANYALMSREDRAKLPAAADHILPGAEFYEQPMHIIFGDDVKITGATAEGVQNSSLSHGAKSFSAWYTIQIDPVLAQHIPEIENGLNTFAVSGELDETITYILNQADFRPVQRLLRLILSETNRDNLHQFLSSQAHDKALKKLYIAALNNDYRRDSRYRESVVILTTVLREKHLINDRLNFI
jgi:hypothetical protein